MMLKAAALPAFVGTILLTVLVVADLINIVTGVMHDVVPAMALLRIYLLASGAVTVFFYVFRKSDS